MIEISFLVRFHLFKQTHMPFIDSIVCVKPTGYHFCLETTGLMIDRRTRCNILLEDTADWLAGGM